ncbi:HlyD family efflux transporter periplasmic adaptor subunit [Streptomyces luomodiensis]|uniref:HlyD family efflux transporter periplasmic adaptor subunit n=1 Tax=Streptomyces luomodiensis TaxID=3026192 RepID=A0ABY9UUS9_9ACTN|nr:HlyD family efflux transporter periplasmic adaptor subunit [Streptomyces sp. SCA4-21]WNE95208.1 HlyD family efflux transporter periplasmic adaptor subunit [Streptomyces sp. SCA4-21]
MEFRRKALENLRQPDDLDSPVRLTRPRAWAVLAVVGAIIVGGLVWSFNGELARSVSVPGILTHPLGVSKVESPQSGTVSNVFVDTGDVVTKGARVLSLVDAEGATKTVRAPFSGRAIALLVGNGQYVAAGATFMTVERTDGKNDRMVAVLFAPADKAGLLKIGDRVDMDVASAPAQAFGLMRGRVTAMDPFPQTEQQVQDFLGGNKLLATQLLEQGGPIRITVDPDRDADVPSGYRWTTTSGPPFRINSWTQVSAIGRLPGERPIDWLLPR